MIICRIIGHNIDKEYNDSGYAVCKRCNAHGYFTPEKFSNFYTIPYFFQFLYNSIKNFIIDKIKTKENNDLPF